MKIKSTSKPGGESGIKIYTSYRRPHDAQFRPNELQKIKNKSLKDTIVYCLIDKGY